MSKVLNEQQIADMAKEYNVDIAAIKAVKEVESRGNGFLPSGRPVILFEGHVFWKELINNKKNPKDYIANNYDIIYPTWDRSHYKGGEKEYDRLNRAIAIDKIAALKSTSFGLFQIMGFNYKLAGYDTVENFVAAQQENEQNQLEAFMKFITNTKLIDELQNKQWEAFAKGYNGSQYAKNQYDVKIEKAFEKYYVAPKIESKPVVDPVKPVESIKIDEVKSEKIDTTKVVNNIKPNNDIKHA